MLTTENLGSGVDDGIEIGVETNPKLKNGNRIHAFLSFANSSSQPNGYTQFTNLAGSASTRNPSDLQEVRSPFYQFDQTNTLSGGASYIFRNGGTAGMSFMYGSGLYSSALSLLPGIIPAIPSLPTNYDYPVRTGGRETISEVNLSFATRPDWLYRTRDGRGVGLALSIENLFNSTSRLEWDGPFAGTRYQQGRTIFVGINGRL
jgi:hypothetical protein